MSKLYWHKLKNSTIKRVYKNKMTCKEVMLHYRQPDWCGYPNAINGILGCWSLTMDADNSKGNRKDISVEYCKDCDCFIKEAD